MAETTGTICDAYTLLRIVYSQMQDVGVKLVLGSLEMATYTYEIQVQ